MKSKYKRIRNVKDWINVSLVTGTKDSNFTARFIVFVPCRCPEGTEAGWVGELFVQQNKTRIRFLRKNCGFLRERKQ